jgi:hypothetical protein
MVNDNAPGLLGVDLLDQTFCLRYLDVFIAHKETNKQKSSVGMEVGIPKQYLNDSNFEGRT